MASKMFHFEDISVVEGNMRANISLSRFSRQFQEAQFWLDNQVMTDMVPLMPHVTGTFINNTRAESIAMAGTGRVCAAAPLYGRFLYMGKVMVDPETGSPWARAGKRKVVTDHSLNYSNPSAVPLWFDEAKKQHGSEWVDGVKKRAGGGSWQTRRKRSDTT